MVSVTPNPNNHWPTEPLPDYVNPVAIMKTAIGELYRVTGVVGFPIAATVYNSDDKISVVLSFWSHLGENRAVSILAFNLGRKPESFADDSLRAALAEPIAEFITKTSKAKDGRRWEAN